MEPAAQAAVVTLESVPTIVNPIVLKPSHPPISVIQAAVEAYFKIAHIELVGHQRRKQLLWPRHMAIWLCCRLTPYSTGTIAHQFHDRDHTTIIHSFDKVQNRLREPEVWAQVTRILTALAMVGWQIPENLL